MMNTEPKMTVDKDGMDSEQEKIDEIHELCLSRMM